MNGKKNLFLQVARQTKTLPHDLEELVLDHVGITQIEAADLAPFANLKYLYLTHNRLTRLDGLQNNIRLVTVDARNNQISSFDLSRNIFIVDLFLANNKLTNLEAVVEMLSPLHNVEVLDLRGNIVTQERGYRRLLTLRFPNLKILDGLEVTPVTQSISKIISTDAIHGKERSVQKKTAKSVLDFLQNQKISEAERFVEQRTAAIKRKKEEKERARLEAERAVSKKEKETYEEAAKAKIVPLPEFLRHNEPEDDFTTAQLVSQRRQGASTRMFLKKTCFEDGPKKQDKILTHYNPQFKALNVRPKMIKQSIIYPP